MLTEDLHQGQVYEMDGDDAWDFDALAVAGMSARPAILEQAAPSPASSDGPPRHWPRR